MKTHKHLPDKARREVIEEYAAYEANCDAKDRETRIYKIIWESVLIRNGLDPKDLYYEPRRD